MLDTKTSTPKRIIGLLAAAILSAAALLIFLNRQFVVDQITVWQYQPTTAVAQLAERATISDKGLFYFYASQPSIEGSQRFNSLCGRKEPASAILGCYSATRIYIYDITDPKLEGIREVTAAHEMLHAAFERLTETEKQRLGDLLEAEYVKVSDKDLQERMDYYARTEPADRINELHSIIGTEVGDISLELEAHYKKYFSDRQKVVSLYVAYQKVFTTIKARADDLVARLGVLGDGIEAATAAYNENVKQLQSDILAFNQRASQPGGYSSQAEFNSAKTELLSRVQKLDADREKIDADIQMYQTMQAELKALAVQSETLNRSIDSSLAPAPQL